MISSWRKYGCIKYGRAIQIRSKGQGYSNAADVIHSIKNIRDKQNNMISDFSISSLLQFTPQMEHFGVLGA